MSHKCPNLPYKRLEPHTISHRISERNSCITFAYQLQILLEKMSNGIEYLIIVVCVFNFIVLHSIIQLPDVHFQHSKPSGSWYFFLLVQNLFGKIYPFQFILIELDRETSISALILFILHLVSVFRDFG